MNSNNDTTALGMITVRMLGRVETTEEEQEDIAIVQLECVDVDLKPYSAKVWVKMEHLLGPFDIQNLGSLSGVFGEQPKRIKELESVNSDKLLVCPQCKLGDLVYVNLFSEFGECRNCNYTGDLLNFIQQWEGVDVRSNDLVPQVSLEEQKDR